jgi:hypothetical protein
MNITSLTQCHKNFSVATFTTRYHYQLMIYLRLNTNPVLYEQNYTRF